MSTTELSIRPQWRNSIFSHRSQQWFTCYPYPRWSQNWTWGMLISWCKWRVGMSTKPVMEPDRLSKCTTLCRSGVWKKQWPSMLALMVACSLALITLQYGMLTIYWSTQQLKWSKNVGIQCAGLTPRTSTVWWSPNLPFWSLRSCLSQNWKQCQWDHMGIRLYIYHWELTIFAGVLPVPILLHMVYQTTWICNNYNIRSNKDSKIFQDIILAQNLIDSLYQTGILRVYVCDS